ncbi:hypothetical protein [Sorangium sp. So ce388]|uniref:hypothetical protein n=1 Tax=Sorangium sp. So ce388 TaxID=3133309 RepID=UPI003F5C646F
MKKCVDCDLSGLGAVLPLVLRIHALVTPSPSSALNGTSCMMMAVTSSPQLVTPEPLGQAGSAHDIGFVLDATERIDPLGLILIGYTAKGDHPDEHGRGETRRAAMDRATATGQRVVRADRLRGPRNPNGISGEAQPPRRPLRTRSPAVPLPG